MPVNLTAKVIRKTNLTGNYWEIELGLESTFDFSSGQYVSIKVSPDGTRRSYSIASTPGKNSLLILVDVSPMGVGAKYMLGLKEGDVVEIMGPMGIFFLEKNMPKTNKMFVATGSGIAPMRSMIDDLLLLKKYQGQVALIWGMRFEKDLFWQNELVELNRNFPNFSYHVVLSKPSENWHGESGHVKDCLDDDFFGKIPDMKDWEFYICGGQDMVMETGAYLAGKGAGKKDIHFEKFF